MTAPELLSAPTAVACPNCGAPQGYPCSQPTDTGRRVVRWTHLSRDAEFNKANERIKREHAEYERELELSQVGTPALEALPRGSIVTAALNDVEGNVAEKASDGRWIVTGEEACYLSHDLVALARERFTILRKGYGS